LKPDYTLEEREGSREVILLAIGQKTGTNWPETKEEHQLTS